MNTSYQDLSGTFDELLKKVAAEHDKKLRTVLTDLEIHANNRLIDKFLENGDKK